MAGSVTYNGVASDEGGNIFKDIKFWAAHRMPIRSEILGHIRNNGGILVPLEKDADVLIADEARKDPPPGSCSWKLITDSVEHGVMQLQDRYRIGPDPDSPRPIASGGTTKPRRTAFTHADDASLAKWVLQHPGSRSGNGIYMEFEKKNSRHTWQSWRNRWEKSLKMLPLDKLKMLAQTAPADPPQSTTPSAESPSADRLGAASQPEPAREAEPSSGSHADARDNEREEGQERAAGPPNNEGQQSSHEQKLSVPEFERDSQAESRDQFYRDLKEFMVDQELDIDLNPRIFDVEVDLWTLAAMADMRKTPLGETDWLKVAQDMGYPASETQMAAQKLQKCYEDSLDPFLSMMREFEQAEDEARSDGEQGEDVRTAISTTTEKNSPEPYVPASPSIGVAGVKRPLALQEEPLSGRRKRRRPSPNDEIPSTPDSKLGVRRVSPVSRSAHRVAHETVQDRRGLQQPAVPLVRRRLEPETQDFGYDEGPAQPTQLRAQESSFDVTPSQQLQFEATDATPIPLRIDRGRRDRDTSSSAPPTPRAEPDPEPRTAAEDLPVESASASVKDPKCPKRTLPASFPRPPRQVAVPNPSGRPPDQAPRPSIEADPRNNQKSNRDEIDEVIERYESLGYPHDVVIKALRCTTITPGLAGVVMQSLQDGHGIPKQPGVWTDRDDESLRLVDSADVDAAQPQDARRLRKVKRERERLVQKHGEERMALRRLYLEAEALRREDDAQGQA